MTTSLYKH